MSTTAAKNAELLRSKQEEFLAASPSRLIELALEDLEAIEANPKYRVNMCTWQSAPGISSPHPCHVCYAGTVMANRFALPINEDVQYEDKHFTEEAWARFTALDFFRQGHIDEGLRSLVTSPLAVPYEPRITFYYDSRGGFKSWMRGLAAHLKEQGL